MSIDNLCKLIAEKYPAAFATWILGESQPSVQVLKTELSIEPIRADSVILLETTDRILHLEFQVRLESEPPLPLRMLDYWVRLYRLYRKPIIQVIILLLPPREGTVIETAFVFGTTYHEYRVIRLWEEDPKIFLSDLALLPLAALTATSQPEQLLAQVAEQVDRIESVTEQREVSAYIQILAGLKFNQQILHRLFQENAMRESVIYQEILQVGRAEGRQEGLMEGQRSGRQEGRLEGRLEGRQEGQQEGRLQERRLLVENLLRIRFGSLEPELAQMIEPMIQLSTDELVPLLYQLSQTELLARFTPHQN